MSAWAVLRGSLAAERARPRRTRDSDELAFLPAAIEVIETPASPSARWLALAIGVFLTLAIAWAWFGEVDVIAVAAGQTASTGRSKVVQPAESGIVRAIHVRDGQVVRKGDMLIEFDPTATTAERERLTQALNTARVTAARLKALLSEPDPPTAPTELVAPPDVDAKLVERQRDLLRSEVAEQRARLAQLDDDLVGKRAERGTMEAMIRRLDATVPLLQERTQARRQLSDQGWGSRLQYLDELRQLTDAVHERHVHAARLAEIDAGIAVLEGRRRTIGAEFRRARTAELAEAERAGVGLEQELIKATQREELQRLAAPIDGVVQQLAIHTIGGVVQPAQALLVIVPTDDGIEVEAKLLNRDVGFVRPGQVAEIKLEAFNFTRYGLVQGEVVTVSGDAIQDPELGPVYAARIRLERASLMVDGREIALGPGMNAAVEIKTDRRRVIDFLLSPLLRYRHEALRER